MKTLKIFLISSITFLLIENSFAVITISPTNLNGANDTAYCQHSYYKTFTASGGTAPYIYTISAGTLPRGMQLDSTRGILSGTVGYKIDTTISFTIKGREKNSSSFGTRAYTLYVRNNILTRSEMVFIWSQSQRPPYYSVYDTYYNSLGLASSSGGGVNPSSNVLPINVEGEFVDSRLSQSGDSIVVAQFTLFKSLNSRSIIDFASGTKSEIKFNDGLSGGGFVTAANVSNMNYTDGVDYGAAAITSSELELTHSKDIIFTSHKSYNYSKYFYAQARDVADATGAYIVMDSTQNVLGWLNDPGISGYVNCNVSNVNVQHSTDINIQGGTSVHILAPHINLNGLTNRANNAAALAAGLASGDLYYTDTAGEYIIKITHP